MNNKNPFSKYCYTNCSDIEVGTSSRRIDENKTNMKYERKIMAVGRDSFLGT